MWKYGFIKLPFKYKYEVNASERARGTLSWTDFHSQFPPDT